MKRIIQASLLFYVMSNILDAGVITNNGNNQVNVVMYGSNFQKIKVNGSTQISAQGRLNAQGNVIPAGQNINFIPGTSYIDVFYAHDKPAIHTAINQNLSYTLNPGENWIITQD